MKRTFPVNEKPFTMEQSQLNEKFSTKEVKQEALICKDEIISKGPLTKTEPGTEIPLKINISESYHDLSERVKPLLVDVKNKPHDIDKTAAEKMFIVKKHRDKVSILPIRDHLEPILKQEPSEGKILRMSDDKNPDCLFTKEHQIKIDEQTLIQNSNQTIELQIFDPVFQNIEPNLPSIKESAAQKTNKNMIMSSEILIEQTLDFKETKIICEPVLNEPRPNVVVKEPIDEERQFNTEQTISTTPYPPKSEPETHTASSNQINKSEDEEIDYEDFGF